MSRGALADLDPALDALSLEDRAELRAAHLRNVARLARDGRSTVLTPAQLADAAGLLDALARLARGTAP